MKISKSRLFFGIIVLLIGVLAALSAAGVVDGSRIASSFWPAIILIFGLFGFFTGNSYIWSSVVSFIGLWALLFTTGIISKSYDRLFFPGIIILVAIGFILGSFTKDKEEAVSKSDKSEFPDYFCAFGGIKARNTSQNFKRANATAIFGGVELNLIDAKIEGDEAVINCTTAFGGIDIFVPSGWNVVTNGIPIFGAIENHTINIESEDCKKLIVKGIVLFGGIEIKSFK